MGIETLTFTRKEMAGLLLALHVKSHKSPLTILQETWRARERRQSAQRGTNMTAFVSTTLPPIMERMIKSHLNGGLSLHDIVALGAQIEYTHFSFTSVQNWVKRDFKDVIGLAEEGKRYSLQQAALFFIIEDLRSALDYEAIRKLFEILFPCTSETDHPQFRVKPLDFYAAYAGLFEELDERYRNYRIERNDLVYKWDRMLAELAEEYVAKRSDLSAEQMESLQNALHVALISVHTSCFHSLARRYVNGMVFLNNMR